MKNAAEPAGFVNQRSAFRAQQRRRIKINKLPSAQIVACALGDVRDANALAEAIKSKSLELVREATGAEVLP